MDTENKKEDFPSTPKIAIEGGGGHTNLSGKRIHGDDLLLRLDGRRAEGERHGDRGFEIGQAPKQRPREDGHPEPGDGPGGGRWRR